MPKSISEINFRSTFFSGKFLNSVLNSNKIFRKVLLVLFDYIAILISFRCSSFLIGYENDSVLFNFTIFSFPIYFLTNQYIPLTRFITSFSFYQIISRNFISAFISLIFAFQGFNLIEIRFFILFVILVFVIQSSYRICIRDLIIFFIKNNNKEKFLDKVVIYKADHLSFELLNMMVIQQTYHVEFFIDDNPSLKGSTINRIPIVPLDEFNQIRTPIDKAIIIPESISLKELIKIKKYFKDLNIQVEEVNLLKILREANTSSYPLNNFSPNKIIERRMLEPFNNILMKSINNDKSVCVTGAGGSIGSELCRQIISMNPDKLILIDFCEYNLYKIFEEIKEIDTFNTKIIPKLVNAENQNVLQKIFREFDINLIFHAAAYKHVPLVEINKSNGIKNNILSTRSVSLAAINNQVEKVILISSDKAVRPTNVMGATKLLSELLIKELSANKIQTIFATVRFGNVIDSSGSVIPLFRKQIKSGGPLTVTNPDMERYFMTISEAVNLVLYTSVFMQGGETFVLNMGSRIKIIDLAKKMIEASGLKVKDINNKKGDIEIKIVGARPGEKLKEELFFNGKLEKTIHPLINIAKEKIFIPNRLIEKINEIINSIENNDEEKGFSLFDKLYKEIK